MKALQNNFGTSINPFLGLVKSSIYSLDSSIRLRVPGDDDGPWAPDHGEPCPFDGVGVNRSLDLDMEEKNGFSYLDHICTEGGGSCEEGSDDEEETEEQRYAKEISRFRSCGLTSAIFTTDDYTDYLHALDCRKAWCPKCGGKGGKVHKARKKAIRKRVDVQASDLRYFVFTVPELERWHFKSRKGVNRLLLAAKTLGRKYFGTQKGMVATIHLFGDPHEDGSPSTKYHPHVNLLIPERAGLRLLISKELLQEIKNTWKRALVGLGCSIPGAVDVFYEFRSGQKLPDLKKKYHLIKYVAKPTWDKEHIDVNLVDAELRHFLVLELKGFQYIRFWGDLANSRYKEGAMQTLREAKEEAEKATGQKMHFRGVVPVNIPLLLKQGKIEKVGEGLYRIRKEKENDGRKKDIRENGRGRYHLEG